ncbi:MAG TPA: hypothetical protein VN742_00180, partial [Candidatus Binataceae bacterium]|nr:hypothetical protein [Candidatus Binataceae bacterium]
RNAVRAAANEALVRNVNTEIIELIARLPAAGTIKPGSSNKGIRGLFLKVRDRLHLPHPHRDGPNANEPRPVGAVDNPRTETPPAPVRTGELRPEAKAPAPRKIVTSNNALPAAGENGVVREPGRSAEPAVGAADPEPPPGKTPPT